MIETGFHHVPPRMDYKACPPIPTIPLLATGKEEFVETAADYLMRVVEKRGVEQGIKHGMKQGIEQGIEQGKLDTARKMLDRGIALVDVLDMTELRESDLRRAGML